MADYQGKLTGAQIDALGNLQQQIASLPDGQAVSATVAQHSTTITDLPP